MATVVPCPSRATSPASSPASASASATPSTTPRDWSRVVGTLAVVRRPPAIRATSVKVPPTSTPTIARIGQEYAPPVTLHRHHSNEASAGDRGRGLGLAQRDRIGLVTGVYARLYALNGLGADGCGPPTAPQALDRISAYAPELGAEIEGIAAGSGLAGRDDRGAERPHRAARRRRRASARPSPVSARRRPRGRRSGSRPGTGTTSWPRAGSCGRSSIPTAAASRP